MYTIEAKEEPKCCCCGFCFIVDNVVVAADNSFPNVSQKIYTKIDINNLVRPHEDTRDTSTHVFANEDRSTNRLMNEDPRKAMASLVQLVIHTLQFLAVINRDGSTLW